MERREFVYVRASGALACFTRPEMKAERVSYEVMTPSAARGLLEAIYWHGSNVEQHGMSGKALFTWRVHRVGVLKPIRWTSFRRNEVGSRAVEKHDYFADDDRQQRNTVALTDVAYVLEASIELSELGMRDANPTRHREIFQRRLEKGQHFQQPYLGCREFAAHVESADATAFGACVDRGIDRPLGVMFYDFDFEGRKRPQDAAQPLFFEARLQSGVLAVPSYEAVLRFNREAAGGDQQ